MRALNNVLAPGDVLVLGCLVAAGLSFVERELLCSAGSCFPARRLA